MSNVCCKVIRTALQLLLPLICCRRFSSAGALCGGAASFAARCTLLWRLPAARQPSSPHSPPSARHTVSRCFVAACPPSGTIIADTHLSLIHTRERYTFTARDPQSPAALSASSALSFSLRLSLGSCRVGSHRIYSRKSWKIMCRRVGHARVARGLNGTCLSEAK